MKFLKIILLLFILISPSNANTIYNLIKIPNLEIYNNKSINGIKYLRANKPFQVGVRNDNVTCFNSNIQTIDEKFKLIEENFNKYNSDFLKKINLKYVVLCENLSVSGIDAGGVPNHRMKTLIINIKFEKKHFQRILHHEVFHLINESFKDLFAYDNWKDFNHKKFNYAECSTCSSDRLNLSLLEETKGFLTEYSMSTPSEDMAEIFSFLMFNKNLIEEKVKNDSILNKKVNFIKTNIFKIDENIL